MNIRKAEIKDIERIIYIAKVCYDNISFNEYVEREIRQSFEENPVYNITFYVIEEDNNIISYAGIGYSMFLYDVYELRLGATLVEYRNRGLLTKLVEYRINEINNLLNNRNGLIQVSTKHPNIYKKLGFKKIFTNNWGYTCMNLLI